MIVSVGGGGSSEGVVAVLARVLDCEGHAPTPRHRHQPRTIFVVSRHRDERPALTRVSPLTFPVFYDTFPHEWNDEQKSRSYSFQRKAHVTILNECTSKLRAENLTLLRQKPFLWYCYEMSISGTCIPASAVLSPAGLPYGFHLLLPRPLPAALSVQRYFRSIIITLLLYCEAKLVDKENMDIMDTNRHRPLYR